MAGLSVSAGAEGAAAQLRAVAKLGRAQRSGLRRGNGPRGKEEGLEARLREREKKRLMGQREKREEGVEFSIFLNLFLLIISISLRKTN